MIHVFSEHITSRLTFVLDFCFREKGEEYRIVTSTKEWSNVEGYQLNYSHHEITGALQIKPQGILHESEIYQSKKVTEVEGELRIDGVPDKLGVIFYLLTRYEEYFSQKPDQHGRVYSRDNILVRNNMNNRPVADELVKEIWLELGCDYDVVLKGYQFTPTFDIDIAWAYKHRNFIRSVGGMLKGKRPFERIGVLTGMRKDPYDTYSEIREIATKTENLICFTLLGDWGKYDKNIHWENHAYGSLIRGLNLEGEIGIHPSYGAHLNVEQTIMEIQRLEEITGHEIVKSRQHFLRLKIPDTYRVLQQSGIRSDYSMGFADQVGFRAGTCFPFYFFDLIENEKTNLVIHPFAYMDSALKDYLRISPEGSKNRITELIQAVQNVGGHFICIWHNSSINDLGEWKGWKDVLDYTVISALKK